MESFPFLCTLFYTLLLLLSVKIPFRNPNSLLLNHCKNRSNWSIVSIKASHKQQKTVATVTETEESHPEQNRVSDQIVPLCIQLNRRGLDL